MDTTAIVDSGTYGIVRHVQILGCIMLIFWLYPHFPTLVERNYCRSNIRIVLPICTKRRKNLIVKFGNDYKRYMQRVQSIFLVGIIRLLRRRKRAHAYNPRLNFWVHKKSGDSN